MRKTLSSKDLREWNLIAGFLHLAQMFAVLSLANGFTLPVVARYMSGPPGSTFTDPVALFDVPVGTCVALFLGLSAFFHFYISTGKNFLRYSRGIQNHHNHFRWVEYSLSSSVMIVLIAMVCGISDVAAIVAIFGVNLSMIQFGWLQEKYETPGNGGLLPFIFGCIAGVIPWIAILFYLFAVGGPGDTKAPGFVYGIVISLFLFFNSFALVQLFQYKKVGRWSDYIVGERTYITLSLVAKSALAWQIFAGTLVS
ncbi:MAG: hypothetical protein RL414_183 [Actinomycetota bacterium]|jgi:hypothetical protein